MKKVIIILVLSLFVCASISFAQTQKSEKPFHQGIRLVQGAIGFVSPGFYGKVKVPPLNFAFEYAFTDEWGGGLLGGYGASREDYGGYGYDYSYLLLSAGISYHFDVDIKNIDAYGKAYAGYVIVSFSTFGGDEFDIKAKGSFFGYGVYVGAIYYLSPQLGVHADIGYGSVSVLRLGLTLKFQNQGSMDLVSKSNALCV